MKKVYALILALFLTVTAFSACGDSGGMNTSGDGSESSRPEIPESSASSELSIPDSGAEVHPCRIVQPGTLPSDYQAGIDAVNRKLAEDGVDIEVEIIRIPWDAYAEKLNLMITSGEAFESLLIMQDVKNLSSIAGMDAVIPIDEYLDKYPELVGRFTDLEWRGMLYNGSRYATPCTFISLDKIMSYLNYRVDISEKVGYPEFPDTVDGIIDLMEKSQAQILEENGIRAYSWMHQVQDTAHWLHRSYDTYPFYVENSLGLVLARQDGTIDSFYESKEFEQDANTYYEMYQKGLIDPDVLSLDAQKKQDDASFGGFLPSNTFDPNLTVTIKEKSGIDTKVDWVRVFPDQPDMIYIYGQILNAVSATAEDPESPIKFFNWLYSSDENYDLFHYGIEGVHYTRNAEDRIERIKSEDGANLYSMDEWMTGYMPYANYSVTDTDENIEFLTYKSKDYVVTPIAGFLFDATNVQSELTNLQTEIIASIYPIKVGMISYDENIGAAIEKLKAAGLDRYMEEYRTQFRAYLDANPDVLEIAKGTRG